MDRGAWRAAVRGAAKSRTRLKQLGGGGSVVKKKTRLPMQETQVRSLGQEDPLGEGNGSPLQYPCLGNPMDRGT